MMKYQLTCNDKEIIGIDTMSGLEQEELKEIIDFVLDAQGKGWRIRM